MRTSPRPVRLLTVCLAVAAVLLAGCTGGDDDGDAPVDTSAIQARLDAAKKTIDDAETVDVSLATSSVPDGVSGLLSAKGTGNHSPAFEGDVKVSTGGATVTAEVIAVDGVVYAKAFTPDFQTIDPATLKAPDPAKLLDAEAGITQILTSTEDLAEGKKSRDGKDVLTTVTGTLPGSVVAEIIPSANADATFEVSYRLTDDDVLRDATMRGPFYGGDTEVEYTVRLATSDEAVEIEAPPSTGGA